MFPRQILVDYHPNKLFILNIFFIFSPFRYTCTTIAFISVNLDHQFDTCHHIIDKESWFEMYMTSACSMCQFDTYHHVIDMYSRFNLQLMESGQLILAGEGKLGRGGGGSYQGGDWLFFRPWCRKELILFSLPNIFSKCHKTLLTQFSQPPSIAVFIYYYMVIFVLTLLCAL